MDRQSLSKQASKQASKRNYSIDFVRGIGILIVVLGHAIQANFTTEGLDKSTVYLIITVFQMELLFLISGYSMGFTIGKYPYKVFIVQKIKRLLVPYIVWLYIHYVILCFVGLSRFSMIGLGKELLYSEFWFLRSLFIYSMIMASIVATANRVKSDMDTILTSLIGFSGVVIVLLIGRMGITNNISGGNYLYFCLGYIFFVFERKVKDMISDKTRTICYLGFFVIMCITTIIVPKVNIPRRVLCFIFTIGVASLSIMIYKIIHRPIKNYIVKIGKNTLPVYAIHWCLLFSPLWRLGLYKNIFKTNGFSVIIIYVIWIIVCIGLITVFRITKWFRILLLGEAK